MITPFLPIPGHLVTLRRYPSETTQICVVFFLWRISASFSPLSATDAVSVAVDFMDEMHGSNATRDRRYRRPSRPAAAPSTSCEPSRPQSRAGIGAQCSCLPICIVIPPPSGDRLDAAIGPHATPTRATPHARLLYSVTGPPARAVRRDFAVRRLPPEPRSSSRSPASRFRARAMALPAFLAATGASLLIPLASVRWPSAVCVLSTFYPRLLRARAFFSNKVALSGRAAVFLAAAHVAVGNRMALLTV